MRGARSCFPYRACRGTPEVGLAAACDPRSYACFPGDVRGVERADDRRVISGIVQVLKSVAPVLTCGYQDSQRRNREQFCSFVGRALRDGRD
jgi:hypothetical protein